MGEKIRCVLKFLEKELLNKRMVSVMIKVGISIEFPEGEMRGEWTFGRLKSPSVG